MARVRVPTPERTCIICRRPFVRRKTESVTVFLKRPLCSRPCVAIYHQRFRTSVPGLHDRPMSYRTDALDGVYGGQRYTDITPAEARRIDEALWGIENARTCSDLRRAA